ncbi:MAG: DUF222 domain-containing protein [Frankia sp.]|nr:DUF222 domain-containing protein [Frankia sp.]
MCETASGLREAMTRFAREFDAASQTAGQAHRAAGDLAAIEKVAGLLKASAARRAAEGGGWRRGGFRSPAHLLAKQSGCSVAAAADALATAERLEAVPEVAAAVPTGELSVAQAAAITDAALAVPTAAAGLLDTAKDSSLAELQETCRRVKATAERDAEARRARIHAERSLRHHTDAGGTAHLYLSDNPEVIATAMAHCAPAREELFEDARRDGRRERPDALDADALLLTLARGAGVAAQAPAAVADEDAATAAGPNRGARRARPVPKILVRVDLDALLRGYPLTDEVCEIAGFGPVAVSAVGDLVATGDAFLAAIATRGEQVLGVAHLRRAPTAAQTTALEWLYPTCAAAGCTQAAQLEREHRVPWAERKVTVFDLLDRLCPHHHELKTHHGWGLVDGVGSRAFVAPDDPRHPGNASVERAPPAA